MFEGLDGADQIVGGHGINTASYVSSDTGVTITLDGSAGTGGDAEGDVLSQIRNLTGSKHAGTVSGSSGGNLLEGLADGDTLVGGDGNDTIGDFLLSDGDLIDLGDHAIPDYPTLAPSISVLDGNTIIDPGDGDSIILEGFNLLSQATPDDAFALA